MSRPFLEAHWSHLCLISYAVPQELLAPHLPRGLKLDTRNGAAFVSLVAFDFDEAKVKGVAIPGHRCFPEVNLRYYVRCGEDRGVCFIREFVPKRLIAWVARMVYNEPYQAVKMSSDVHRSHDGTMVEHRFRAGGHTQKIVVNATPDAPLLPPENSEAHFFKEHHWGFGNDRNGQTLRYRVNHPQWLVYKVGWHEVKVDWARVYGPEWKVLNHKKPCSVVLAEGSHVQVYPKGPLTHM